MIRVILYLNQTRNHLCFRMSVQVFITFLTGFLQVWLSLHSLITGEPAMDRQLPITASASMISCFQQEPLSTIAPVLKFKPSVLIDYSFQNTKKLTQFDINGNFIIADLIWAGGSWRISEQVAVGISAGTAESPADVRIFIRLSFRKDEFIFKRID